MTVSNSEDNGSTVNVTIEGLNLLRRGRRDIEEETMEQLLLFEEENEREARGLFVLKEAVRPENLLKAYSRVKRNKGVPGVAGMNVKELGVYLRSNIENVREQLLSDNYLPQRVLRKTITKPGGGVRELGIPTCLDRLIQQALMQVLTPIFESRRR